VRESVDPEGPSTTERLDVAKHLVVAGKRDASSVGRDSADRYQSRSPVREASLDGAERAGQVPACGAHPRKVRLPLATGGLGALVERDIEICGSPTSRDRVPGELEGVAEGEPIVPSLDGCQSGCSEEIC